MQHKNVPHVVVAPEMFLAEGGIARVSRHYLQAIAQSRPHSPLRVVVLNDNEVSAKRLRQHGATRAKAVACSRNKARFLKAIWNATQTPGAHVTCTHVHLAPALWLLQRLGRRFTYDKVVHGIEVWKPLSKLQQISLTNSRRILSVSEYTRREILKRYPDLGSQIVVLPNALDPSFTAINEKVVDSVPYSILTVSRLAAHDHEKGIDHLIAAMPEVLTAQPDATLRIVGEGVDRKRLEELAAASSAMDSITFLGFVADPELKREFAQCSLFALPSKKEGFGLVYLEAMSAGKPCIVADAGGAPEVIGEQSGMIVPYADCPKLAAKVTEAFAKIWDPEKVRARAEYFSLKSFSERWDGFSPEVSSHT